MVLIHPWFSPQKSAWCLYMLRNRMEKRGMTLFNRKCLYNVMPLFSICFRKLARRFMDFSGCRVSLSTLMHKEFHVQVKWLLHSYSKAIPSHVCVCVCACRMPAKKKTVRENRDKRQNAIKLSEALDKYKLDKPPRVAIGQLLHGKLEDFLVRPLIAGAVNSIQCHIY